MSSKFQFLGINFTQQLKDKEEPPNLEVLFVIHLDVFVVSKIIRVDCDDVTGKQDKSGWMITIWNHQIVSWFKIFD